MRKTPKERLETIKNKGLAIKDRMLLKVEVTVVILVLLIVIGIYIKRGW